jgi:hypothetical protein
LSSNAACRSPGTSSASSTHLPVLPLREKTYIKPSLVVRWSWFREPAVTRDPPAFTLTAHPKMPDAATLAGCSADSSRHAPSVALRRNTYTRPRLLE